MACTDVVCRRQHISLSELYYWFRRCKYILDLLTSSAFGSNATTMPSSQERTQLKTVTGFIVELPSKKSDESDDDEDDDDDDNWLDYSQIKSAFSQGTFVKMSRKPRYSRGKPVSLLLSCIECCYCFPFLALLVKF